MTLQRGYSVPPSFLLDSLSVKAADGGLLAVTVLLPPDLVADYCRFLESLSGFFHAVKHKSAAELAQVRAVTAAQTDGNANRAAYRDLLVRSFDAYLARGLDRKEAVKRVAADLRAQSHPWCAVDLVRSELVAAGRGGCPGRPSRRGEP